jgi:DNA-binding MarR family transcriptional regulator
VSDPVRARFDAVIHAPNRLQITSMLSVVVDTDFATLRDALDVSDSVLSKHLRTLEEAGYVHIRKPTVAGRVRTRVSLTPAGRRAFEGHIAELRRLAAGAL